MQFSKNLDEFSSLPDQFCNFWAKKYGQYLRRMSQLVSGLPISGSFVNYSRLYDYTIPRSGSVFF